MKFFRFLIVFLLGFFLVSLPIWAQDFPEPTGHVNDFAQLLSSDYRQSLEQELVDFEEETTAEIAVVTIESLEGDSIEEYAVRLFEQWGIGKKEKDNGLLILIAKEDREMRIEVGYGLEPVITDGRAGRIIREKMRPAFREENYDQTSFRRRSSSGENLIRFTINNFCHYYLNLYICFSSPQQTFLARRGDWRSNGRNFGFNPRENCYFIGFNHQLRFTRIDIGLHFV